MFVGAKSRSQVKHIIVGVHLGNWTGLRSILCFSVHSGNISNSYYVSIAMLDTGHMEMKGTTCCQIACYGMCVAGVGEV